MKGKRLLTLTLLFALTLLAGDLRPRARPAKESPADAISLVAENYVA